jgi:hypothetical protein
VVVEVVAVLAVSIVVVPIGLVSLVSTAVFESRVVFVSTVVVSVPVSLQAVK